VLEHCQLVQVEKDGWLKCPCLNCSLPIKRVRRKEMILVPKKKRTCGHASNEIYTGERSIL
jgi:hypothetical protein